MTFENALLVLRNTINILDKNLVVLLAERKELSVDIARIKIKKKYPIRDIEREKTLLNNLHLLGKKNNLSKKYIENLFNIIIENSVFTQKYWMKQYTEKKIPLINISFLGNIGSYSHLAAKKFAKKKLKLFIEREYNNFSDILSSVETNQSDYAIIPIENKVSGLILEAYQYLKKTSLFIIDEITIDLNHCLLVNYSTQLLKIKTVYSHSQPFKQCSLFINYFPNWKLITTTSTSKAVEIVVNKNDNTIAALGNEYYTKIYKLETIVKNISNIQNNTTRFIVLAKKKSSLFIEKSTFLMLTFIIKKEKKCVEKIKNVLRKCKVTIKQLKFYTISNTSLETIFFININNNTHLDYKSKILENLKKTIKDIKILGCYPL